jgi:protein-tyrosine-phosphatase/predicted ATP-grasp superfamily ATP-dependent carboligase
MGSTPVSNTVVMGFADSLSAAEVAWSLVEGGFQVVAFAARGAAPALQRSRFVRIVYVADPQDSVEESLFDLQVLCRNIPAPIVMPLDDKALWLIKRLGERAPTQLQVAGPVGEQAELALDKLLQLNAASAAGFAVPKTRLVTSIADLTAVSNFPFVLKPQLAARAVDGRLGRGDGCVVADAGELKRLVREWNAAEPMLMQPFLKGSGEGVFGIALKDGVVAWSGHQRVRMMNPAGSGASACVSRAPSHEVRQAAERFLKASQWRGMFMIELLRDVDGQLWFMELNGRSWGSMALARRTGLEYPLWTVRARLDPRFVPSVPSSRPAVLCRHLGREIVHLGMVWRGPRSRAQSGWPGRFRTLRDVIRRSATERWYNYNPNDPRVFWADTWQTVKVQLFRSRSKHHPRGLTQRVFDRVKTSITYYQQQHIRARQDVQGLLNPSTRILFVCYGNINRSALAEQYLKQLLGSEAPVSSCGFHVPDGRPLDPTMRSLADAAGIRFGDWSSQTVSRKIVDDADIVFAMEARHIVRLVRAYPQARGRTFLLSCVTKPGTIPLEIEDPFGADAGIYNRCIQHITFATKIIHERLARQKTESSRCEHRIGHHQPQLEGEGLV